MYRERHCFAWQVRIPRSCDLMLTFGPINYYQSAQVVLFHRMGPYELHQVCCLSQINVYHPQGSVGH